LQTDLGASLLRTDCHGRAAPSQWQKREVFSKCQTRFIRKVFQSCHCEPMKSAWQSVRIRFSFFSDDNKHDCIETNTNQTDRTVW